MPRLTTAESTVDKPTVQFVFEPMLDMMNAMYFTHLVVDSEGVEGWPVEVRRQMSPDLLAELDFLYSYPKGQPGIMGQLGDVLYAHPEAWMSVADLLAFVRSLPSGIGSSEADPGIQGLAFYVGCSYVGAIERREQGVDPREQLRRQ